jgi:hypothetical protein
MINPRHPSKQDVLQVLENRMKICGYNEGKTLRRILGELRK